MRYAMQILTMTLFSLSVGVSEERKGPLAGLPSASGPHLEKIQALGENQWLDLGSPAPDPKWGKGRGRAWAAHMAYAPELRAAFIMGGGVHGFLDKKTNRMDDDLFVYDLNAHRWICIYPGTDITNVVMKMDANGFEVDLNSELVPIAQLNHAWENMVYDTDRKKYMFMPACSTSFAHYVTEKRKAWGGYTYPLVPPQASPWMYNTLTGKFELLKVKGGYPGPRNGSVAGYFSSTKTLFYWIGGSKVWIYDIQANAWSNLSPKGPPPTFGMDASACMDLKRDRIYMGGGYYPVAPGLSAFWCYDLKTNAWLDLQPKGNPSGGCKRYGATHAVMNHDSVHDAIVLFYHALPNSTSDQPEAGPCNPGPEALGIYIYDPAANSWSEKPLALAKELLPTKYSLCYSSFYCPELNAHFIHVAGDSQDNGSMWVYRYKQAKK